MNATMNIQILKGYDKFILWGAFRMGEQALIQLREAGFAVSYFCDGNKDRWGDEYCGVKIVGPSALPELMADGKTLIIICSSYAKHIIASTCDDMGLAYVYFSKPIFVEITSFCNHKCTFCPYEYIEREKGNLDFELAKSFLCDLRSENSDVLFPAVYPHVLGEPLVSKDFWRFLDLCKELQIFVCIVTNFALIDEKVQQRLFENYPDIDVVLSVQGATEQVFHWRGETHLTHEQWINRIFEIIEAKFKYGHKGLVQICTICPDVVNGALMRTEEDLHMFEWYDGPEGFKAWKREFGGRCVAFAEEIKSKYPENYEKLRDAGSPIHYYYNLMNPQTKLDDYVNSDDRAQFEFLPNVHIYPKNFGLWGVEKYFDALLPEGKYFYWEENWYARPHQCDRVGDVSLLSSGQLVMCNIDNEADFVFADLRKGEKYTDAATRKRIQSLRNNLTLSQLCRRCKARVHVFDKAPLETSEQEVTHYGIRWHKKQKDELGFIYRTSYEYSYAFVYTRIYANALVVDIRSVQDRKHYAVFKQYRYDEDTKNFTDERVYAEVLKPCERKSVVIPFAFEQGNLYRIDYNCPTQDDVGIGVYNSKITR